MLDIDALRRDVDRLRAEYRNAQPFPHIVIDEFARDEVARAAAEEFRGLAGRHGATDGAWLPYVHVNEHKYANTSTATWGPTLQGVLDALHSPDFVGFVESLSGIHDLECDETLEGGGLHVTRRGGHLNIHADFTVHPKRRNWRRRINLLWYLNETWSDSFGGSLELWSADMRRAVRRVTPAFNRALIFTTDATSYHGHPDPLTCPPDESRRSLALYYFAEEDAPVVRATDYRARPGEGIRAIPIYLDKTLLRTYDALKRRLPISDETMSRLLGRLDRTQRRSKP